MDLEKYMNDRHQLLLERNKLQLKISHFKRLHQKVVDKLDKNDLMLIKEYKPTNKVSKI